MLTDFVVLAPLELEINALASALDCLDSNPRILDDGLRCLETKLPREEGRSLKVHIIQLNHQGVLPTAVVATKILGNWRPWCIVSFGISGGFVGDDLKLGDVVVPETVYYYEPAKETEKEVAKRGRRPSKEVQPQPLVFNTSLYVTTAARRLSESQECEYSVKYGPIASGEKLIADLDAPSRRRILSLHRKMLGVEMEAAGVGAAVRCSPELGDTQFVVVKGISDDATRKKGAEVQKDKLNRQRAAQNAATFLAALMKTLKPKHDYGHEVGLTKAIKKLSEKVLHELPKVVITPPVPTELQRVLFPPNTLPPVYYHWRAGKGQLHIVDFCFLGVLKRLRKLGLPTIPLVTDDKTLIGTKEKRKLERTIHRLFQFEVEWFSEIVQSRGDYVDCAIASGLDNDVIDRMRATRHTLGLQKGNLVDEEWLQYMVWAARDVGRFIVLIWHRHAQLYSQVLSAVTVHPLLILCKDIRIGRNLAKWEGSARELFIEPPSHPTILKWLQSKPSKRELADLARCIAIGLGYSKRPAFSRADGRSLSGTWASISEDIGLSRLQMGYRREIIRTLWLLDKVNELSQS